MCVRLHDTTNQSRTKERKRENRRRSDVLEEITSLWLLKLIRVESTRREFDVKYMDRTSRHDFFTISSVVPYTRGINDSVNDNN